MHFLDYVILALLGYNAFVGLRQGAIRMISGILGIIIATTLSKHIFEATFDSLGSLVPLFVSYPFLYFSCCFLVLIALCHVIAHFLHTIFTWSGMGLFNHIFGLLLGSFRGLIIVLIFVIPLVLTKPNFILQSSLVYITSPFITVIIDFLNESGFINHLFQSFSTDSISSAQGGL